jgi:MoaA/NifB/PqqE/SkfB family radical SAM enzyme
MGFVFNYLRNVASVAFGREPVEPLLFSYYVTHRCDLNCRYCCDGDGRRFKEDPIPELTTSEAKRLLSILRGAADTLDVTGGEPMMREDLEEILARARELGLRTVLNTKGIGLERRPDLMRFSNVLVLSIDTIDLESLAKIIGRSPSMAEGVIDGLHFALSRKKETGTKLILSAVAAPTNLDGVSKVLQFAMDREIAFHVSPEIVATTVNPGLRNNPAYDRLIARVIEAKRGHKGILGVPKYLQRIRDFGPYRCHPLLMPTIRPDGKMYYPCLESKRAEVNLLEAGDYRKALREARGRCGEIPRCKDCCHIFCHMAISLYQRHPLSALGEFRHWRG